MLPPSEEVVVFGIECLRDRENLESVSYTGEFGDIEVRAFAWEDDTWSVLVSMRSSGSSIPEAQFSATGVSSIEAAEDAIRVTTARLAPPVRVLLEEVRDAAE